MEYVKGLSVKRTLWQPRCRGATGRAGPLFHCGGGQVVGLLGVVNHQRLQRTREIGRIALGAEALSIGRLVLWRARLPTALAITLGVWVLLLWTPTLHPKANQ
jgi:hypothetical protein